MSITKKGLIVGLCIGIIIGIYGSMSDCHFSVFPSYDECNLLQKTILVPIEEVLTVVVFALTGEEFFPSPIVGRIMIFTIPVILFGLIGLLIGIAVGKVKSHDTQGISLL